MADLEKLEKVIKELEEVIAEAVYPDRPRKFMMSLELAENALALLKAQEPVKPVRSKGGLYHCGGCGEICVGYEVDFTHSIIKVANYCHKCGRAVKWG